MVQAFSQVPQACQNLQSRALRVSMQLPKQSFQFRYLAKIYWTKTQKLLSDQFTHINITTINEKKNPRVEMVLQE